MQKTSHETIAAIVEALESSGAKAVVTSEDPLALFFNTSPDEPVNVIADSGDSEPRVLCGFVGDDGFGGDPGVRCGNESASVEWLLVNTEKFIELCNEEHRPGGGMQNDYRRGRHGRPDHTADYGGIHLCLSTMHRVTAPMPTHFTALAGSSGIAYGYVPVFDVSIDLRIEELDLFKVPRISVPLFLTVSGVDCRPDAQAAEIDFIRLRDFPGFRDELALGRPGRNEFDGSLGPERVGEPLEKHALPSSRRHFEISSDLRLPALSKPNHIARNDFNFKTLFAGALIEYEPEGRDVRHEQHARRHVFEHEIERRDVRPGLPHRSMQLAQLIDRHRIRLVLRFHENAALLAMLGWRRMDGFAIIKPFAVGP